MGLNDDTFDGSKPKYYITISHKREGGMGYNSKQGNSKVWVPCKNISGYIQGFDRKWDEGSPADKIKAHWQYELTLADEKGMYIFALSEHLLHTSSIFNYLLAVDAAKPISISVRSVDVAKNRVNLMMNYKGTQLEVARKYNEWDSENATFVGIPPLEDIPNSDKKDSTKRCAFWFECFKNILYPLFNGGAEYTEQPKTQETTTKSSVNIHEGTNANIKPADFSNVATPKEGISQEKINEISKYIGVCARDKTLPDQWAKIIEGAKNRGANMENLTILSMTATYIFNDENKHLNKHSFKQDGSVEVLQPVKELEDDLPF